MEKQIIKIALTGGPCAGKSTALCKIREEFTRRGYTVLTVGEAATELIMGGISPRSCNSRLEFQSHVMLLQHEHEQLFLRAVQRMNSPRPILMVCDRGILDNKAYLNPGEFEVLAAQLDSTPLQLRDDYDAVFHMETAAKINETAYTVHNNPGRVESAHDAADIDSRLIAAWVGHPHLRIIGACSSFDLKLERLIDEIAAFIGDPEPLETERKFLISYPDTEWLDSLPNCARVDITQTYLPAQHGVTERIRSRGVGGDCTYTHTCKKHISGLKCVEQERRITHTEYCTMLTSAGANPPTIRKQRYCLCYGSRYFELDIFPFWNDKAILEIELLSEDEPVIIPAELNVIKEVTYDPNYKNYAIAAQLTALSDRDSVN